jgi:hypothetical protein
VIAFNRKVGLNLVVRAACGCLKQWAEEQKGMRTRQAASKAPRSHPPL